MFIYFWEIDTEREWGKGRETHAESKAGSRLWAVSTEPHTGLELMSHEIMTWVEVGHLTNRATQTPPKLFSILTLMVDTQTHKCDKIA